MTTRSKVFLSILAMFMGVTALLVIPPLWLRKRERPSFAGWGLPLPGNTLDINRDGIPDVKGVGSGFFELRTAGGWVPFHFPLAAFPAPRWITCPGMPKGGWHAVMFLKADDGNHSKFCSVDDVEFSQHKGRLPKSKY